MSARSTLLRSRPFGTLADLKSVNESSPFLKALPENALARIPFPMLDFHVSGGVCRGPLLVKRGNLLGSLVATLGRLPPATPEPKFGPPDYCAGVMQKPNPTVVESQICAVTGDVLWKRLFPPSTRMESRWYWSDKHKLAVDSFTYLGIRDFGNLAFLIICHLC